MYSQITYSAQQYNAKNGKGKLATFDDFLLTNSLGIAFQRIPAVPSYGRSGLKSPNSILLYLP